MKILLLGATGYIGSAVLTELLDHDHSVIALARSDAAEQALTAKGVEVVRGDLRDPERWAATLHQTDAIIHAAATFTDDMGEVDRRVIEALITEGEKTTNAVRFIYTGGCWLYGKTGDRVATEDSPFDPLPAFSWMVDHGQKLLQAPCFETVILHPAMAYDRDGGAIFRFLTSAKDTGSIEVWGALETRWPVVHRDDLATAYRLALESGVPGQPYNVAAEAGVPVARIVEALSSRLDLTSTPSILSVVDAVKAHGDWAAGPAMDQQMSGRKIIDQLGWRPERPDILADLA